MQQQQRSRQTSGAKAVALDPRMSLARYRLYMLLSLILSVAFALGLQFIFAH
ncbi:hypothetical protein [Tengunoibacter tsumagoiensis]|uniref:Uncharacterized protein n=1 Tax=Tengunoibacter tsumagoiensis TaxID=2014871 RepID=A0A402A0R1_9CHLR|nr:hypothetical protein [Tengunoibacter tsumagoiensis]GCE12649.1 hypothetical protein KTT_25080 [Tengunoibacter tsumagoiensis]